MNNTKSCCADKLNEDDWCRPECQQFYSNQESAITSDVSMYYKIEADPETGKPTGCGILDEDDAILANCTQKEDFSPEGQPLYEIGKY